MLIFHSYVSLPEGKSGIFYQATFDDTGGYSPIKSTMYAHRYSRDIPWYSSFSGYPMIVLESIPLYPHMSWLNLNESPLLVGGFKHECYFPFSYMGCHPSQLTNRLHHFSRWWNCTHQPAWISLPDIPILNSFLYVYQMVNLIKSPLSHHSQWPKGLRSCGVDVPLFPAALESQEVPMVCWLWMEWPTNLLGDEISWDI